MAEMFTTISTINMILILNRGAQEVFRMKLLRGHIAHILMGLLSIFIIINYGEDNKIKHNRYVRKKWKFFVMNVSNRVKCFVKLDENIE